MKLMKRVSRWDKRDPNRSDPAFRAWHLPQREHVKQPMPERKAA